MSWIWGEDGVADGETVSEVTIELFDEFGNAVVGTTPEFTASGDDDANDYQDCAETDDEGLAVCGMTTTQAGEQTLEIVEPVEVVGEAISFSFACLPEEEPFGGGDGSEEQPHVICTPEHLENIYEDEENHYLEDSFVLAADLDMDGVDFEPLGETFYAFIGLSGTFDGMGHTIQNLTIEVPEDSQNMLHGLFRKIGEDGVVRDLHLDDVYISSDDTTGAIAGENYGEIVRVSATDIDIFADDALFVGGLVGSTSGVVDEAYATGVVHSERVGTGGLFGRINGGEVSDTYAAVEVIGDEEVGGLSGRIARTSTLSNSYAIGDVDGDSDVGAVIGRERGDNVTIEATYWDDDTSNVDDAAAEPLTTGEFGDEDGDHFDEWDFEDVWEIGEAPDGEQRPIFWWQDE